MKRLRCKIMGIIGHLPVLSRSILLIGSVPGVAVCFFVMV
jgi:hypothetical protein